MLEILGFVLVVFNKIDEVDGDILKFVYEEYLMVVFIFVVKVLGLEILC